MAQHLERERAECFGADADAYDRARPDYPSALVDDLVEATHLRVLDVGCGTGKVARLFADRGCEVLGVEADERMAAVASASGVTVEVGRFESWRPRGRAFDLVASGQAWHWVDPALGNEKAASVLLPGGRIALFWNYQLPFAPEQDEAVSRCYARHAPALGRGAIALGRFDSVTETERHVRGLVLSGRFAPPVVTHYPWEHRYARNEWVELVGTHSDHAVLPGDVRSALFSELGRAIDEVGGVVDVRYETVCVTAVVRGDSEDRG